MKELIQHDGQTVAIIIRSGFSSEKTEFFTENKSAQQVGYLRFKKGQVVEPHIHRRVQKTISETPEVLFIKSGLARVHIFSNQKVLLRSCELHQYDLILLLDGGHAFEFLEETEAFEIKQGPYMGREIDKETFSSKFVEKGTLS